MSNLLRVTVSRRGDASWSLRVLEEFTTQFRVSILLPNCQKVPLSQSRRILLRFWLLLRAGASSTRRSLKTV
jgi:hypothetical protein